MVVHDGKLINSITKELYPGIALRFNATSIKVNRDISYAIEEVWERGKLENINTIFGFNIYIKNDIPSNGEFIALVAEKLRFERTA